MAIHRTSSVTVGRVQWRSSPDGEGCACLAIVSVLFKRRQYIVAWPSTDAKRLMNVVESSQVLGRLWLIKSKLVDHPLKLTATRDQSLGGWASNYQCATTRVKDLRLVLCKYS
jgi:hypothetical protein